VNEKQAEHDQAEDIAPEHAQAQEHTKMLSPGRHLELITVSLSCGTYNVHDVAMHFDGRKSRIYYAVNGVRTYVRGVQVTTKLQPVFKSYSHQVLLSQQASLLHVGESPFRRLQILAARTLYSKRNYFDVNALGYHDTL
jgi:hypothetical protein